MQITDRLVIVTKCKLYPKLVPHINVVLDVIKLPLIVIGSSLKKDALFVWLLVTVFMLIIPLPIVSSIPPSNLSPIKDDPLSEIPTALIQLNQTLIDLERRLPCLEAHLSTLTTLTSPWALSIYLLLSLQNPIFLLVCSLYVLIRLWMPPLRIRWPQTWQQIPQDNQSAQVVVRYWIRWTYRVSPIFFQSSRRKV